MIIESHKSRRGIMVFLVSFVLLSGCSSFGSRKAASKLTTITGAKIEQTGTVETPAHVETNQTRTEIPLSANSTVSIVAATENKPASVTITAPAPTAVIQTQTVEKQTAAIPTAPPTPLQTAQADGVRTFYYVAASLAVLALVLGYAGHVKAAAFAFLGAVGIPFAVHFLSKIAASFVGVVSVCIAGTLFAAWFLMQNHPEFFAEAKAKIATAEAVAKMEAEKLRTKVTSSV